jgi:hypothetical protein
MQGRFFVSETETDKNIKALIAEKKNCATVLEGQISHYQTLIDKAHQSLEALIPEWVDASLKVLHLPYIQAKKSKPNSIFPNWEVYFSSEMREYANTCSLEKVTEDLNKSQVQFKKLSAEKIQLADQIVVWRKKIRVYKSDISFLEGEATYLATLIASRSNNMQEVPQEKSIRLSSA